MAVCAIVGLSFVSMSGYGHDEHSDDNGDRIAHSKFFNRVAAFPAFQNTDAGIETIAEIVAASTDGNTLIYTDGKAGKLGFVDITDPANPAAGGTVDLPGEPTSVAVHGEYALVVVNTSADFFDTSGELVVVDIPDQTVVADIDLGGQPDSIAISPDGRYAAVAIENERDEDWNDGLPPQSPAGFLVIVDLVGEPADWRTRTVDFTGLPDFFTDDPEPEYVDINRRNIAAVTLQENNHIVLVRLQDGSILRHFSAGKVNLSRIDAMEEAPALITLDTDLHDVPREPDGVAWIDDSHFATADEGDLFGGSRGFTIFKDDGSVTFTAGSSLEHAIVRLGHYPDGRSENRGSEPENVEYGRYGDRRLLFVGSERSSVVLVYEIENDGDVALKQVLPAGAGPEGLLAIPDRNLFIAASEVDDRDGKLRSVVNIYRLEHRPPDYPTVVSANRTDGTPIPWGALSGLAAEQRGKTPTVYGIHDGFYRQSRIHRIDVFRRPAVIMEEIVLHDAMDRLAAVEPARVNSDSTVNLDAEAITTRADGGFWIASEGNDKPPLTRNLLVNVSESGIIEGVVTLPQAVIDRRVRFGFEGIASIGSGLDETLYVAFQREWRGDPQGHVRIGRYQPATGHWSFFYYPLDDAASPNGGWVGLSELISLGSHRFAVIERDNQAGPDARIKRIYAFSTRGLNPLPDPGPSIVPAFPLLEKTLVRDLIPDLEATGGLVLEKPEGMALLAGGDLLVVNDNGGVDHTNGETQLMRLTLDQEAFRLNRPLRFR